MESSQGNFEGDKKTLFQNGNDKSGSAIRRRRLRSESITEKDKQITFSWSGITVVAAAGSKEKQSWWRKKFTSDPEKNPSGQQATTTTKKVILKNVCGFVRPGELVAIMGASGAGKSTLLNTLTFRNLKGLEVVGGGGYANGVPVTPNSLTAVSGYVQQDDLFFGTLTVREQLQFQALVRMDREIPRKTRMERVEEVIEELGLSACADKLIGTPGRIDGISGGELKRLSFGCEVLTNPSLFFCDEPTSGLDSYMAQTVIEVLRKFATHGKTIVCTIHQPSSQIYALFDRVLLMAEGRLAYLGDLPKAKEFFESVGFPCPPKYNPADHYIHVLAVTPGKEEACRKRVHEICDHFRDSPEGTDMQAIVEYEINHGTNPNGTDFSKESRKIITHSPYKATWWQQFRAVLWRNARSTIKEPLLVQVRIFQTLVLSILLGLIYLNQDFRAQEDILNINGALFLMMTNVSFQYLFGVIQVFCTELPIFLREHFNGMYRTDIYFICKQLTDLPIFVFMPLLFVSIYYWMVGFHPETERFFITVGILILLSQVVVSFGYLISCVSSSLDVALALTSPLLIPFMLFGGFFINASTVPDWLLWLEYLSWFRYGNELLMINEWKGVSLNCNAGNGTAGNEECNLQTGDDVIDFYGFDAKYVARDVGLLFALAIAFRLLGFFALLSKTNRKH